MLNNFNNNLKKTLVEIKTKNQSGGDSLAWLDDSDDDNDRIFI